MTIRYLFTHNSQISCLFIIKIYCKVDYFLKIVLINIRYEINCKTAIESKIISTYQLILSDQNLLTTSKCTYL